MKRPLQSCGSRIGSPAWSQFATGLVANCACSEIVTSLVTNQEAGRMRKCMLGVGPIRQTPSAMFATSSGTSTEEPKRQTPSDESTCQIFQTLSGQFVRQPMPSGQTVSKAGSSFSTSLVESSFRDMRSTPLSKLAGRKWQTVALPRIRRVTVSPCLRVNSTER